MSENNKISSGVKAFFLKIKNQFSEHMIRSIVILLVGLYAVYWGYGKFFPTVQPIQYITQAVEKTTITVAVSGTGQVLESNKMDLKPLSSGNIVAVNAKNGDAVKAGQPIASIDQKDSLVALNQAKASLLSAQANYDKLVQGATVQDVNISQNSVNQAQLSYQKAQTDLESTKQTTAQAVATAQKNLDDITTIDTSAIPNSKRDSVLSAVSDAIFTGQTAMDAENKVLSDDNVKNTFSIKNATYGTNARNSYPQVLALLVQANSDLATANSYKSDSNIDQAVNSALNMLNAALSSLNSCYSALVNSIPSGSFTQSNLDSYKSSISGQVNNVSGTISSLRSSAQGLKDAITSAQNALDTAKINASDQVNAAQVQVQSSYNSWQSAINSLNKLKTPATTQDLEIARAQIISAQAQYEQAQNNYNNNIITAPFDGIVSVVNIQKGDPVTTATVVATIITKQQVANVSLNEVDVAKVRLGQKAVLTFDAIDGLSITGKVNQIDTVGTVSSNVVTYNVEVTMDTQDDRIKSGMSTNVDIITDARVDVLAVPNGALKSTSSGNSYVQVLGADGKPQRKDVQVGVANDSMTEIISGLSEGDNVITQTIDPNAASTGASGGTNRNGQGGGGIRIPGFGGRGG